MKLSSSSFLSVALFFGTGVFRAASTPFANRRLHANQTDLSNGAVLGVDIESPAIKSAVVLGENETALEVSIKGQAHVGKGIADVGYIYIIDSSGSTLDEDGACGTTLECVQAFFEALNKEVIADGSAEVVAVIDFDDYATVTADFQDPQSNDIGYAIHRSSSDGGTACTLALEKASLLVLDPKNTAGTTVVVFAGDGLCNYGEEYGEHASQGDNVTGSADILGATGAIVHSIAVGDNVDCVEGNDLNSIPRNGGKCFSIPEPDALPSIIDDLIGTSLEKIEVKVDDGYYKEVRASEVTEELPVEGAVAVGFDATVGNLFEGTHELCVRVTGADSIGGTSQVEDCHSIDIKAKPVETEAPVNGEGSVFFSGGEDLGGFGEQSTNTSALAGWQVFLIVAGCAAFLGIALMLFTGRASSEPVALEASRVTQVV